MDQSFRSQCPQCGRTYDIRGAKCPECLASEAQVEDVGGADVSAEEPASVSDPLGAFMIVGGLALLGLLFFACLVLMERESSQHDKWKAIANTAIAVLLVPVYLLPSVIAVARRHRDRLAIAMLNIVLGWTGIGWIALVIWAAFSTAGTESSASSAA